VGQHHPLGAARAAGGELEEGEVPLRHPGRLRAPVPAGERRQLPDRDHPVEAGELGAQEAGEREDLAEGDEDAGFGRGEDPGLAAKVVLDLAAAGRRIEGDGDAARELGPHEGREIFEARGEHEPNGLARLEAERSQPGSHGARPPVEVAVGQLLRLPFSRIVEDVPALRVALDMPVQDLQERPRSLRRGLARTQGLQKFLPEAEIGRAAGRQGLEEVARRLRRAEDLFGELDAEGPLQALDQLDPPQAVEPEVAFQRGVERQADLAALRMELAHHRLGEGEHLGGRDRRGLGARGLPGLRGHARAPPR
jgi:hypothetical protein